MEPVLSRMKVLAVLLTVSAFAAQEPAKVVARGEGSASAKPDEVRIQIGVTTQAATAQEAGAQNAKQSSAVIAELKQQLGTAGEYQTMNYSLHPTYRSQRDGGKPTIAGYQANNTVEVRLSDVSAAAKAIDAATKSGANQIQGIHFSIKDEQKIRSAALAEAATQARSNAQALASALGLKIVRLVRIEDGQRSPIVPMRAEMMMMKADTAQTPVEPGVIEVKATVTVTAEVAP